MSNLPGELVTSIIAHCIPQWSLRLEPYFRNSPDLVNFDHVALEGLPYVTNLKLVNKQFYYEVSKAVHLSFTGRLNGYKGDVLGVILYFSRLPQWLWDRITTLELQHPCPSEYCRRFFTDIRMPSLQRVVLRRGLMDVGMLGEMPAVFTGRFDDNMICELSEFECRNVATWGFWLGKMKEGKERHLIDTGVEWRVQCDRYEVIEISGHSRVVQTANDVNHMVSQLQTWGGWSGTQEARRVERLAARSRVSRVE